MSKKNHEPTFTPGQPMRAEDAQQLLNKRPASELAGLVVRGHLSLANNPTRTELPADLAADSLDVSGCTSLRALPPGLKVRRLNVSGCTALEELPEGLQCYELAARSTTLRTLPASLRVGYRLDLEGSASLTELPEGLKVGSLILRDCTALEQLPEGLDVYFLDIAGCTRLARWPLQAAVRVGRLNARGCLRLTTLPPWLRELSQLDVSGCESLSDLPAELTITSWLDIAGTQIGWLPVAARGAQLRWRGVPIEPRVAFQPETITAAEVLAEQNAELRRVLLERMGYERFLAEAEATTLDTDTDPGGERRLLRVDLGDDEPLVCVAVLCPSTGRQYLIRVPPTMRTCHQAAAWIAGFDNPNDYHPIVET